MDLETVPCLCGSESEGTIILAEDQILHGTWTYRRCPECSLERLSPRPRIGDMGQFYPDDYSPYSNPAPQPTSRVDRLKRVVYETFFADPGEQSELVRRCRPLLRVVLRPFKPHSVLSFDPPAMRRVFEFGAGTGADLVEFRNAGWEVFGCEPSPVACAAAARNGIRLVQCSAEEAELPNNLSCIYMNNVFEHLHDPPAVLAKAREKLITGGLVVLIVPNHASWGARMFGSLWPGYDPPRHLWGYTPTAIRRMLRRAGFEVAAIVQKAPLSKFCWGGSIEGYNIGGCRTGRVRFPTLRRIVARALGRSVIVAGMVAAAAGAGDYIRVVARKGASSL
jgi:SAM-dependent methyltransferase